jgi:hypothetical protein
MFEHLKQIGPGAFVAAVTKSFLTLYLLGRYAAMSGEAVADRLVNFPGPW